jgi:hypothetical protein
VSVAVSLSEAKHEEIHLLKQLRHPNIVHLREVITGDANERSVRCVRYVRRETESLKRFSCS